MAAPRAARGRRRCDGSLGQIPLSTGEIELYSRQDEAARRRRRLLAVREQERRLAQQVTQRYRDNLQKLQRGKSKQTRRQLSVEQQKLLTDLHVRYQNSLQSMGTAQRNARLKLLELMEQAQEEKGKWAYNLQVAGKQRSTEAQEAQQEAEKLKTAKRRQVEQNVERLKVVSGQQRHQASIRARREQELAIQRAKGRDEIERLRSLQSPQEVIVTPRPNEKDVLSYQVTRTHCLAPMSTAERRAVTVIRHNRKHPTAMRGEEEAQKYRDEMDRKREQKRLVVEEQVETAAERGKQALEDATSRQKGQQALDWLALVDKMKRRARGQELSGRDASRFDAGDVDEGTDDPKRMAERAFAQMLGLDENSVELSAFSIETDEEQSVGLADTDHESYDSDKKVTDVDVDYRVQLRGAKHDAADSLDKIHARRPQAEVPIKATTFGDLQREELGILKKAKNPCESRDSSQNDEVPLKSRDGTDEDILGKPAKGPLVDDGGNISPDGQQLQWGLRSVDANTATADDRDQHRYQEERPEGTDSEEEELSQGSEQLERDDSIERLENRLQEVLELRISRPRQDQSLIVHQSETERVVLSSRSATDQRVNQLDQVFAEDSRKELVSRHSDGGIISEIDEDAENACANSVPVSHPESGRSSLSLSVISDNTVPSAQYGTSAMDERSGVHDDVSSQSGRFHDTQYNSRVAISTERDDIGGDRRFSKGDSSQVYPGGKSAARLRDDRARVSPEDAGDNYLGSSAASSKLKNLSGHYRGEREYEEAGREERDNRLTGLRSRDAVAPPSKEDSAILDRNTVDEKVSPRSRDRDARRLSSQPAQEKTTDLLGSEQFSATRHAQTLFNERDDMSSSSSITSDDEEFHDEKSAFEGKRSRVTSAEEDERSMSESSFAPSQKSFSRLDQVANTKAGSLEQRFIHQHMMSFSSSEGHSDDEEDDVTEVHRLSTSNNEEQPSANINPYDPYRQQMDHHTRRSSTSAVSIAQYSLPPSDTQSSFDDSFDRLHPGHGDDSFVNELVPMFPKRALPPPPWSLEDDNRAVEEYDVQLIAPNMSRMLTSERRTSFGRSRQHLAQYEPQSGSTERPHRQFAPRTTRSNERSCSTSSRRNSSGSSNSDVVKNIDESVEPLPVRQQPVAQKTRPVHSYPVGHNDSDESDISSDSGVSSLGFAVQLNLLAGTSRRRNDDRQEAIDHGNSQQSKRTVGKESDDDLDSQSNASRRSVSSSSCMSMDAHLNYLTTMSSAVEKSLPLHLRIPAMIYGKKDMTKPPAPMTWSASSVSSIASEDNERPDEAEADQATRLTVENRKEKGSQLPPPPLDSIDMSRPPPPPMQTLSHSLDESHSSSEQPFDLRSSERYQLPPPVLDSFNMKKPPFPMRNFNHDLNDSQSSSEQSFEPVGSFGRHILRHFNRHSYGAEERKQGDSCSESGVSSLSDELFTSSSASPHHQNVKKAEKIVISANESTDERNDDYQAGKEMSLAEAFQQRHPGFGHRVENHRDELKRQGDKQQHEIQQQRHRAVVNREAAFDSLRGRDVVDDLSPVKEQLLNRLASGSRAKISQREMKERNHRLYHQLPEVVERKRQEEVMRRRRERLNELREQEKERRLQQKQRRQQQRR